MININNLVPKGSVPDIVDEFWNFHLVTREFFNNKQELKKFSKKRAAMYPYYEEFMEINRCHKGETVLDFGCGQGYDVLSRLAIGGAKKVIGLDVSTKSLELTKNNLSLCNIDTDKVFLGLTSNAMSTFPFIKDNSIDFIHSGGTIHHTTFPEDVFLKEFYRVLKSGGEALIEVHNKNSLYFHLYVAYEIMIHNNSGIPGVPVLSGMLKGLSDEKAFSKSTDGHLCPISRCYYPAEFARICRSMGFTSVEFKGGYLSDVDTLHKLEQFKQQALDSDKLRNDHKKFINSIKEIDGSPYYKGKLAGIGAVFKLRK